VRWVALLLSLWLHAKECQPRILQSEEGFVVAIGKERFLSHAPPRLVARTDLDGDGEKELIYQLYSGGAHCCFSYVLIDGYRCTAFEHFGANVEKFEPADVNFDGVDEILTFDDYSYAFGLCFACSPFVEVVLRYSPAGLRLDPLLLRAAIPAPEPPREEVWAIRRQGEWLFGDDEAAARLIGAILARLYRGEGRKGAALFEKFRFQPASSRQLLARELMEMVLASPFWPQIARANGLLERNGSLMGPKEAAMKLFSSPQAPSPAASRP